MDTNNLPSTFLTALSDPFTLLVLLLAFLCFILYKSTKGQDVAYKRIPVSFIAGIGIALSLTALGLNVGRQFRSHAPPIAIETPKKTSTLQVTFYGTKSRTESVTVPFRVSSGQINVGCGDLRETKVDFAAPLGARGINAVPSWENIRDVKQQDKNLSVQGTLVTARGQLVGNNREWTGNCPGGGHGELVITGTYVIDQSATPEQVVLSTFQGFVPPNSSVQVPIPPTPSVPSTMTSEVLVANAEGATRKLNLTIDIDAAGNATGVVPPQPAASGAANTLVAARVEGKNLTIDVR